MTHDFDQPGTEDFHSAYLIKAVSARFIHCNVTLFSFVINRHFVGKYFETI